MSFDAEGTKTAAAADPKTCCYSWVILCPGGRPLRDGDRAVVADRVHRSDFLASLPNVELATMSAEDRRAVAEHWATEAQYEHASVASFAVATIDLLALGAPSELLEASMRAGASEVEHASACFALAARYGAEAEGPSNLAVPTRPAATFASVACEAFREGCVGETIASLVLRQAAGAAQPGVAEVLLRIAEDEEGHATLAFRTVAWALRQGGAPVLRMLEAELSALRAELETTEPQPRRAHPLAPHGLVSAPTMAAIRREALADVVLPCLAAILEGGSHAITATTATTPRGGSSPTTELAPA